MTELELLRRAGAGAEPTDEQVEAASTLALSRLRAAIADEVASTADDGAPGRVRRWWDTLGARPLALAGAAALTVAAVAVAGIALTTLRPSPATADLDQLAAAAGATEVVAPSDGLAVYTKSEVLTVNQEVVNGDVISFQVPQIVERWLDGDGRLRIRSETGAPRFFSAEDEAAFLAAGLGDAYRAGTVEDEVFEPATAPETRLDEWSTDPDELRDQMLDEVAAGDTTGTPQAARMLELGSSLLQATGAPPELRAAVLRVLAGEDGVESVVAGPLVVVSVDFTRDGRSFTLEVEFDAATARILTETLVANDALPGGIPAGAVARSRVNEPSVPVADLETTPTTG